MNTTPVRRAGHARRDGAWFAYDAPPFAVTRMEPWREEPSGAVDGTERVLANRHLEARWDDDGALVSLTAHGREFSGGHLNRLVVHRDPWSYFDAWDIDPGYRAKRTDVLRPESVEIVRDGPRVIRRARYRHGRSLLQQDAVLTADSPYLSFETRVDWRERFRMLRAEFEPREWPDEVTCDIQLGALRRSTLERTEEERAQFEICAHRWVDLTAADSSAGLTLINDSKYGHRAKSGLLSLNLLRSPVYPDRQADRGRHEFRYALYPHLGPVEDSAAADLALDYNAPVITSPVLPTWLEAPFSVEGDGVWLDVVKAAEDGEALVLRLHEARGRHARVALRVRIPYGRAVECDLLERPLGGGADLGALDFRPFQIRTFLLER